jgi:hypothetical protein
MIYVDLPTGGRHGWGVVGDCLAEAIGNLAPIIRLLDDIDDRAAGQGALLQSVTRPHLRSRRSHAGGARHVGYAVVEQDLEA